LDQLQAETWCLPTGQVMSPTPHVFPMSTKSFPHVPLELQKQCSVFVPRQHTHPEAALQEAVVPSTSVPHVHDPATGVSHWIGSHVQILFVLPG
jgi:hypothetical protein